MCDADASSAFGSFFEGFCYSLHDRNVSGLSAKEIVLKKHHDMSHIALGMYYFCRFPKDSTLVVVLCYFIKFVYAQINHLYYIVFYLYCDNTKT